MSIDPKMQTLLEGLARATSRQKLSWNQTDDPDTFEAWVGGYRFRFKRGLDANRDPYFDLTIKDAGERTIDTAMIDTGEEFDLATDLYFTARRQVLGLDFVLDAMLANIEAIGA